VFYVASREDTGVRYEKNVSTAGTATHHHYLYAGNRMVGVVVRDDSGGSYTRYFHSDRLGSITAITNEVGQIVERLSYSAWGKRRFANGVTDTAGTPAVSRETASTSPSVVSIRSGRELTAADVKLTSTRNANATAAITATRDTSAEK
jgi:hypothetical protein